MTLWLYTEEDSPLVAGPFFSLEEASDSFLWEWRGVCVWIEAHTSRGWVYENACWLETHWLTTSRGCRPAEVIRPAFLGERRAVA